MRRKILLGLIALVLAAAIVYTHRTSEMKGDRRSCDSFHAGQVVQIVVGPSQGVVGVILQVSATSEDECIYLVRSQRGVEMPINEWYDASEIYHSEE